MKHVSTWMVSQLLFKAGSSGTIALSQSEAYPSASKLIKATRAAMLLIRYFQSIKIQKMAMAQANTTSDSNILLKGGLPAACQREPIYTVRLKAPATMRNLATKGITFLEENRPAAYRTMARKKTPKLKLRYRVDIRPSPSKRLVASYQTKG